MISGSSVLSALLFYTVVLLAICLLRKRTGFLKKGGVTVLMLAAVFATLRLFLPIEMPFTHAIRSWNLLGMALRFFRAHPTVTQLLLAVWGVGIVALVGMNIHVLHLAHKRCHEYTVVESEAVQELARRMSVPCPVVVSPDVELPYVAGFVRHTIYLPVLDFSEEKIGLILAHESQHIRSHDALIKLFFGVVTVIMWWNPVAHWFRREIDALLEFRCDAKVLEQKNAKEQCTYVEMLKELASRLIPGRRVPALTLDESLVVGKDSVLTQRCEVILKGNSSSPKPFLIAVQLVLLILFFASYLVILQPAVLAPAENFHDDSRTYYEEKRDGPELGNGANTFILKGSDGRYQLFIDYEFNGYLSEDEVASDSYQHLWIFEEGEHE